MASPGGPGSPGEPGAPRGATASTDAGGRATWTWPAVDQTVLAVPIREFRDKFLTPDGKLDVSVGEHRVVKWKLALVDVIKAARASRKLPWAPGQLPALTMGASVEVSKPRKGSAASQLQSDRSWVLPAEKPEVWLVLKCCVSRDESCPCPSRISAGFFWADLLNSDGSVRSRGADVPLLVQPYAPKKEVPQGCAHLQGVHAPAGGLRGAGAAQRDEAAKLELSGYDRRMKQLAGTTGTSRAALRVCCCRCASSIKLVRPRAAARLLTRLLARADEDILAGGVDLMSPENARKAKQRAYEEKYCWGTLDDIEAESKAAHARQKQASQAGNPYAGSVHTRFFPETTMLFSEEGIRALHKVRGLRCARARVDSPAVWCEACVPLPRLDRAPPCVAWPAPRCSRRASRCGPARPASAPPVQLKLDNESRALLGLDWAIIVKEEPGEQRMFTLVVNVSGGARARTDAGVSMWTPLVMFTVFPNAESIKALLRAVEGAELYYCGSVAHQPWFIMDGAREQLKAVCEACNGCSVGETLRRIREAITRGERPYLTITCPTRDKYHITAATSRWADTRMVIEPAGLPRTFFKRFLFKVALSLWDAGRAGARPGALEGVALTADEHKTALQQADDFMRFVLHITSVKKLQLVSGNMDFCAAATLRGETSVDELTSDDANAFVAASNYDALPAGDFEALSKKDTEPPPPVKPHVAEGEFYERFFSQRYGLLHLYELRIYLLKKRSDSGKLRRVIKAGVVKDLPQEQLFVRGIDMSEVIETDADVLERLDEGEVVDILNLFENDSLHVYCRVYRFPLVCVAACNALLFGVRLTSYASGCPAPSSSPAGRRT
jgi:hypothetical protein